MRGIASYIAHERPVASRRLLQSFRASFRHLAANPHIGTGCDSVADGLRHITPKGPAHRYVVFFRPAAAEVSVEIVAIIDASRDWATILSGYNL